jgi:hypothetical protein
LSLTRGLIRSFVLGLFVVGGCAGAAAIGPGTAREGDRCGRGPDLGPAARCAEGLHCQPKEPPTQAKSADRFLSNAGGPCGGVAGFHCVDGLECDLPATAPADGMGVCIPASVCARGPASKEDVAFGSGPGGDSGVGWRELTIERSWGPCEGICLKKRHVFPSGDVVDEAPATAAERAASPDAPKFVEKRRQLAPADLRALDALLRSRDFRHGMKDHFDCATQAFDANVVFAVTFADGTARTDVTTCIVGRGGAATVPAKVEDLTEPR